MQIPMDDGAAHPLEEMRNGPRGVTVTAPPVGIALESRIANVKRGEVAVIMCPALPPAGNMYIPEIAVLQAKLMVEGASSTPRDAMEAERRGFVRSPGYVTVRFNFRGVGGSQGNTYFRSTKRECEDVRCIARWSAPLQRPASPG